MVTILAVAVLIAPLAFAQSSGNFTAEINTTACELDTGDGSLSGGIPGVFWETTIKVPNGSGTSLYIIPSFVSGTLTKTKLSTGDTTSSAYAGVEVCVDLDQGWVNGYTDPYCVIYDKHFQQLNSNLFTTLLQDCDPVAEDVQPCFLELVLSTLSAHSFNFVAYNIPGEGLAPLLCGSTLSTAMVLEAMLRHVSVQVLSRSNRGRSLARVPVST